MEEEVTHLNHLLIFLSLYNHFQLASKYLQYYISSSNGKGHGVHSPFVFDFIKNVLRDQQQYPCYSSIEQQRKKLLANDAQIEVEDFGAGSKVIRSNKRIVKDIAASSLKPKKYAQLLFRMVQYYKPVTIVELGTSLGTTSAYLANGDPAATLFTCEGSSSIASIAKQTFDALQLKNIELIEGDFTKTLPLLFSKCPTADFVFIDGNHREKPTIEYFEQFLMHSTASTIMVFDDIHWSKEMESAWAYIQQHPAVKLTIDLFFIGLVFINPDFKARQHFAIRY